MPKRYDCDLSHFTFQLGDIGKLQTLTTVPIIAGDSCTLNYEGVFRMSPLRRQLVVDAQVELYAFFVPHRHIYGEEWIKFIKDGIREQTVFPTVTFTDDQYYLGGHIPNQIEIPLWLTGGYNRIWNRYFRSPNDLNERSDDFVPAFDDLNERTSGFRCGYLPVPWSTAVPDPGVDDVFRDVPSITSFDLADLNRIQAAYRTDVDREYFGQRYNDLLNTRFGSTVNTDADERPTLVARSKFWLSGYDVDGTDDSTLGSYSGKSAGIGRLQFRRKYFSEHGALRIMCLIRFPTIHVDELPFLFTVADPSYIEIAGDPDIIGAEPPEDLIPNDYFRNSTPGATSIGQVPFGQHYRYHPSIVHNSYNVLDGYAFLNLNIGTQDAAHYIQDAEYDDVFQTLQLRHWNVAGRFDLNVKRVVPPSRGSLYAGG